MATPTQSNIVEQIRRVADIETDGNHITDDEIKEDINYSLAALWAIIVNASNGSIVSKVCPELVPLGDHKFGLPDDFLRLTSVDIKRSSKFMPSTEADQQRYAQLLYYKGGMFTSEHFLEFNLDTGGYELSIFPAVSEELVLVRYIPEAPQLNIDTDVLALPADWVRWVVYDVAIKCKIKDDTNPQLLLLEREKIESRIDEDVRAQAPAEVKTIRRVERSSRNIPPDINFRSR